MLGVERSNIELIIFFILSLALTVNYYSSISGLLLLLFASILKIHPVFGFIYLLKEEKEGSGRFFSVSPWPLCCLCIVDSKRFILRLHNNFQGCRHLVRAKRLVERHRTSPFFKPPCIRKSEIVSSSSLYILTIAIITATCI